MVDDLRRASDAVARSSLFEIDKLWRQRFGTPWSRAELMRWLVQECGKSPTEAENMPLHKLAEMLDPTLTLCDLAIWQSFSADDEYLLVREIVQRSGYSEREVKERLRPGNPLRVGGYVVKGPPRAGYRRGRTPPDL